MIRIEQTDPRVAFELSIRIPELDPPYTWGKWESTLRGREYISLVAYDDARPVGCKVGYDKGAYFYSWVGGVLPDYRRAGVAKSLAVEMERLLRSKDVEVLRMKTMRKFNAMLLFAQSNGFEIVAYERDLNDDECTKIVLEKKL